MVASVTGERGNNPVVGIWALDEGFQIGDPQQRYELIVDLTAVSP